ncbi:MAG: hypothetical protein U0132_04390 [Gemmatimonadaceae bacterium]
MRPRDLSSSARLAGSLLLLTMAACNESDPVAIEDPIPVPGPAGPVVSLTIHGPTWLVVGAHASYWASRTPEDPFPYLWVWSSDAAMKVSSFSGPNLSGQAVLPGTAVVSVTARGADTAHKVVTVLPRPTAATPMEQSPIAATSFRLLEERTGQSDVYYAPLVDVAPRADGILWILEATFDLPGVSLLANRCSTNRRAGKGGALFGGYYGDHDLWLGADSSYHATGRPVLHLLVMDASGSVTQVSVAGTLVDYDYALVPPPRYPDAEDAWTCG